MRLEDISAEIRPRGSWEAADLGWAMARENLPRLLAIFALTSLPLYALFGYFGKWWLLFAIWWLKPALDRPLLYFLSRKLFGAEPRLGEILKAWPKMLWQSIPLGLLLHRFSPSRSFTLPVRALEGLKGSAASDRTRLLGRYGDSSGGLLFACLLLWVCVWAGLLVFAYWFLPPSLQEDAGFALSGLFEVGFPPAFNWALVIVAALATMLTEPFYVAAGFGIYLNSRTHLEGWDIEITFRRIAKRIEEARLPDTPPDGSEPEPGDAAAEREATRLAQGGGMGAALRNVALAAAIGALVSLGGAPSAWAQDADPDPPVEAEAIEEGSPKAVINTVMEDPDFEIHKRTIRVPRSSGGGGGSSLPDPGIAYIMSILGYALLIGFGLALIGGVVYLVMRYSHIFAFAGGGKGPKTKERARSVMGMDITPESLPQDIAAAARMLWGKGDARGALKLLYRGSIAWMIDAAGVPIEESDTEGDCLRRARRGTDGARAAYFATLTDVWILTAYATREPEPASMEYLLGNWPYRGSARSAHEPGAAPAASPSPA